MSGTERDDHDTERRRSLTFTALGTRVPVEPLAPGLHIVATPIGNLRDISLRALATLAGADAVLAEDTRVSRVLLAHYGINTPLIPYHEHNAASMRPQVLGRLAAGEALALISDAGTPLVSDPGYKLVADVVAASAFVTAVPGASAVMAGLVLSGLPTDRFFFEGFLPEKSGARRTRLSELASVPGTLVFFESARRLADTLADVAAVLGPRPTAVARELTKKFEEVRRGTATELSAIFAEEGAAAGRGRVAGGAARRCRRSRCRDPRFNARGRPRPLFGQGRGGRRGGRDRSAATRSLRARRRARGGSADRGLIACAVRASGGAPIARAAGPRCWRPPG